MVEQDLHYIRGIVVDYFVFEWSMDVITWYVYIFFFPGRYTTVVILHKYTVHKTNAVNGYQPTSLNERWTIYFGYLTYSVNP